METEKGKGRHAYYNLFCKELSKAELNWVVLVPVRVCCWVVPECSCISCCMVVVNTKNKTCACFCNCTLFLPFQPQVCFINNLSTIKAHVTIKAHGLLVAVLVYKSGSACLSEIFGFRLWNLPQHPFASSMSWSGMQALESWWVVAGGRVTEHWHGKPRKLGLTTSSPTFLSCPFSLFQRSRVHNGKIQVLINQVN